MVPIISRKAVVILFIMMFRSIASFTISTVTRQRTFSILSSRDSSLKTQQYKISGRTSILSSWMSTTEESATTQGQTAEEREREPPKPKRVLSGVQPTGSLHLGNYLGAIQQWVAFQDLAEECYFCVVDLHAITMPHDPKELSESTLASAALYLAAGIDPTRSKIFVQSHVPAHAELTWLLSCITPMNWLERMIQFKEKSTKNKESVSTGLFTYPVLMAADILLYQADQIPVGEDQRQHLELARDICRRTHDLYCKGGAFKKRCQAAGIPSRPVFTEPQAMIVKSGGARVMSLQDGTKKMSKSDPNDASRINVLDPPDVIRQKIKRCKTDAIPGIEWDNPERPEATNLLNIYQAVQPGRSREDILAEINGLKWGDFKPKLADAVIAHLEPIQTRYNDIRSDDRYLHQVLADGAACANKIASRTLHATRVVMGFVTVPPE